MMAFRRLCVAALITAVFALSPSAEADLPIEVVSVTSPVKPGAAARVEIRTAAAAVCDIEVVYRSGPSQAAPLRPRRADEHGRVVWLWRVGKQVTPGRARIMIECLLGEEISQVHTQFTIR